MPKTYPTLDEEHRLLRAGFANIAGLDEAGRGAWAGPVAAAAVILPLGDPKLQNRLCGICDSKLCTARQRETFYERIGEVSGVVFPSGVTVVKETDQLNLYYGAADSTVAVATAGLSELLEYIMSCPEAKE